MSAEYINWKCPACGDICSDPIDLGMTSCHNHHVVTFLEEVRLGWMEVELVTKPSATKEEES